eukprot:7151241-Alexandrium_andersonii.AAC.1
MCLIPHWASGRSTKRFTQSCPKSPQSWGARAGSARPSPTASSRSQSRTASAPWPSASARPQWRDPCGDGPHACSTRA